MKAKVLSDVDVKGIRCELPVRYDEDDIPRDFPFRTGNVWDILIDGETGKIAGWPEGRIAELYMKVVDEGVYHFIGDGGHRLAVLENAYVPSCIPGEYGDYIDFSIDGDGVIAKWANFWTSENISKSWPIE